MSAIFEGWYHPNVKSGQVHDHKPVQPQTMHRLCEKVYRKADNALEERATATIAKLWEWLDNFAANIRHWQHEERTSDANPALNARIQSTRTRYNDTIDVLAMLTGESPEAIKEQHEERQVTLANG